MTEPQIWHYGLVARDWAEFQTAGGQEASYFRTLIGTFGQPALDLGCGTGDYRVEPATADHGTLVFICRK